MREDPLDDGWNVTEMNIDQYVYIYISRIHTRLCACVYLYIYIYTCVMKNGIIKLGLCQQKHDFSMLVLWYFPIRLLRCHSTCWANAAVWHDFLQFVASNFRIRNYRVESASPESTSKRSDQRRRISVKDDPGSTSCINGRDEGFLGSIRVSFGTVGIVGMVGWSRWSDGRDSRGSRHL